MIFKDINSNGIRISSGENRTHCDYCDIKYDGGLIFGYEHGNNSQEYSEINVKNYMTKLMVSNPEFYNEIRRNCTRNNIKTFEDIDGIDILNQKEYSFLKDNPLLGENIILLAYGGSHAYGTNVPESDIDIRGIALSPIMALIGNENFEQYENSATDTVIYSLNKMFSLLVQNNPNTIEILGCRPEEYILKSKYGEMILENRHDFLSKRCIYSFGGYANTQLRRLQNALARDHYNQTEKETHIFNSLTHAIDPIIKRYHTVNGKPIQYAFTHDDQRMVQAFNEYNKAVKKIEQYRNFANGGINIYLDTAENPDMTSELFCDVVLNHYPLRDYKDIWNELNSIVKSYDKLGKRNNKKDDAHLNKHAMHLVRLFLMCIDILEKEEIITYRSEEHDLLMQIRGGEFQNSDSTYRPEFFEMIDELERRFKRASEETSLPDKPNYKRINNMLCEINEEYIVTQYNNRVEQIRDKFYAKKKDSFRYIVQNKMK